MMKLLQGDSLAVLETLPAESVNCCITSPPYWGLRDYGTAKWDGGAADCDHIQHHGSQGPTGQRVDRACAGHIPFKDECGKCGAVRVDSQIGLERTPAEFIEKLVAVFREVRRVLRDDGTLWVNIGDSYNAQPGQRKSTDKPGEKQATSIGSIGAPSRSVDGLKPKDLIGVPWMLAFALRADGWWLRQDIIWHKPNPMPESIKDRCTKAHEYIFLLSKSQRYYYDFDAMKEPTNGTAHSRGSGVNPKAKIPAGWDTAAGSHAGIPAGRYKPKQNESFSSVVTEVVTERNRRSVWTMPTQATPDAHFATFPLTLPETCLMAGCPVDGTVLDPFNGAGTTGLACLKNGRNYIGIELNAEYLEITRRRFQKHYPLFSIEGAA